MHLLRPWHTQWRSKVEHIYELFQIIGWLWRSGQTSLWQLIHRSAITVTPCYLSTSSKTSCTYHLANSSNWKGLRLLAWSCIALPLRTQRFVRGWSGRSMTTQLWQDPHEDIPRRSLLHCTDLLERIEISDFAVIFCLTSLLPLLLLIATHQQVKDMTFKTAS